LRDVAEVLGDDLKREKGKEMGGEREGGRRTKDV